MQNSAEAEQPHSDSLGRICGNLYVGDINAAQDAQRLEELGIRHVVDMANLPDEHPRPAGCNPGPVYQLDLSESAGPGGVLSKLMVRIDDVEGADLGSLFGEISEYITSREEPTLVHCFEGKSRSVAAAVAFLMMVSHTDSHFGCALFEL